MFKSSTSQTFNVLASDSDEEKENINGVSFASNSSVDVIAESDDNTQVPKNKYSSILDFKKKSTLNSDKEKTKTDHSNTNNSLSTSQENNKTSKNKSDLSEMYDSSSSVSSVLKNRNVFTSTVEINQHDLIEELNFTKSKLKNKQKKKILTKSHAPKLLPHHETSDDECDINKSKIPRRRPKKKPKDSKKNEVEVLHNSSKLINKPQVSTSQNQDENLDSTVLFDENVYKEKLKLKNSVKLKSSSKKQSQKKDEDLEMVRKELDKLYGDKWRDMMDVILKPKSPENKTIIKKKTNFSCESNNADSFSIDENKSPISSEKLIDNSAIEDDSLSSEKSFSKSNNDFDGNSLSKSTNEFDKPNNILDSDREKSSSKPNVKSSDDDDDFENYINKWKKTTTQRAESDDNPYRDDDSFINDDSSTEENDVSFYLSKPPLLSSGNSENDKNNSSGSEDEFNNPGRSKDLVEDGSNITDNSENLDEDGSNITDKSDNSSEDEIPPSTKTKTSRTFSPSPGSRNLRNDKNKIVSNTERKKEMHHAKYINNGVTSPVATFLSSLSENKSYERKHPEALKYLKNFKQLKEELANKLFEYFNKNIFDNILQSEKGVLWNPRLRKTAGYCKCKKVGEKRSFTIELSTKVSRSYGIFFKSILYLI